MRRAMLPLGVILSLCGIVVGLFLNRTAADYGAIERPIIAQVFADPDHYVGRKIEIYGLVIESQAENEFILQDVSQRPLRVVGGASVGDQLTVIGKLYSGVNSIYLAAERIIPTKVIGGGGCC